MVVYRTTSQTSKDIVKTCPTRTFPAESKPNIKIRTSWSLLHRTSDVNELNRVDIDRPMEEIRKSGESKKGREIERGMSECKE